jgi:predicted RNA methylase
MAARSTFKISDEVRDVLARSTITATSVTLPPGQLERNLYTAVNKALEGAGGKWNRKAGAHVFDRDPRELLGLAVETGKATNVRTALQAFYTPQPLAERVAAAVKLALGHRPGTSIRVLEPSVGEGALALAVINEFDGDVMLVMYDVDDVGLSRARDSTEAAMVAADRSRANVRAELIDFLAVEPHRPLFDAIVMNPPFTGGADISHVTHAWRFVRSGGVLVAIMSPHFQHAKSKAATDFRDLLASLGTNAETKDIPSGTFEHTDISTVLVLMRKPAG